MAAPVSLSGSTILQPGVSQPTKFSGRASAPDPAPTTNDRFWDKLTNRDSLNTPKIDRVGPDSFLDREYFKSYAYYRSKRFRPNRKVEVRAFVSLQHLIIERLGQKVEGLNNEILQAGDNDIDKLERAQLAIHAYHEAIDDLEKMLERPTAPIGRTRRKEEGDYLRSLIEQGIELRLIATGYPTPASKMITFMGNMFIGPLLTSLGIMTLILPMVLILFIPNLSRGAAVGITVGALVLLSSGLHAYSIYLELADALNMPIANREIMSGKEILATLAAYAAVLFVFLGAYLVKP